MLIELLKKPVNRLRVSDIGVYYHFTADRRRIIFVVFQRYKDKDKVPVDLKGLVHEMNTG